MTPDQVLNINYIPKYIHLERANPVIDGKLNHPIVTVCYIPKLISVYNQFRGEKEEKALRLYKKEDTLMVSYGISLRNPSDRYDRKKGNAIALERAKTVGIDNAFILHLEDFCTREEIKRYIIKKIIHDEFYSCMFDVVGDEDINLPCNKDRLEYFCVKFLFSEYNHQKKDYNNLIKVLKEIAEDYIQNSK